MSIASEITRIQNAKTALKTSINAKTDSQHKITNETIDDYSNFVDSITGGGEHTGAYKVESVAEMNAITDMETGDYCIVEDASSLPNEYQEVEYLESNGTQYIDTNYAPYKTQSEIKFQTPTKPSTNCHTMGCWNENNNRYYVCSYANDYFNTADRQGNATVLSSWNNNIHTVIYNNENNKVLYDGVQKASVSDLTTQTTGHIYLFARYNGTTATEYYHGRIYYLKITDKNANTLVRHLIPCVRKSDSVAGMYDIVNNVFYTNIGTGTFITGEEIINYTVYKYNGTSWVEA